jgi:hypothetical protein
MATLKWIVCGWLLWLAGMLAGLPAVADGQEFRVDTELFESQEKKPFLEQLTIFAADGTVYDLRLTEPQEVTVFDPRHGRFTLLDEVRKAKAAVTTQELLDFSLALETHAGQENNRLFAFCAVPKFEIAESPIERNGQTLTELKLSGRPLTYVAQGLPVQRPEAQKAYRQFADWCARLNATRPGNLPPGARLALNQALAERELLPLEITRIIPAAGPLGKKQELRSEHRVNWTLCGEDHKKIQRAGDMMATFQAISFDEYRGVPAKLTAGKQAKR